MADTPNQDDSTQPQPEVIVSEGQAPPPARGRKRRCWWIPAVVVLIAAVAAGAVYYVKVIRPAKPAKPAQVAKPPTVATGVDLTKAVSPDADLWVEVDLSAATTAAATLKPLLDALEKSGLKSLLSKEIDKVAEEEQAPFSWEKDLEPWIGYQAGFAVSDLAAHLSSPAPPPFLGVVTVRDEKKAEAWLSDLAAYIGKIPDWKGSTTTRGRLTIREFTFTSPYGESSNQSLAFAISDRLLFISSDAKEIPSAAARMKGEGANLASAQWYRDVSKHLPTDALLTAAWSPRVATAMASQAGGIPAAPSAAAGYGSGGGAVWLTVAGDTVELASYGLGGKEAAAKYAQETAELGKVNVWDSGFTSAPKDSLAVGSLGGLSQITKIALDFVEASPFAYGWQQAQEGFRSEVGLDLRKDVIEWVDGVSVALLGFNFAYPNEDVHLVGEIQAKPGESVEERLRKLEEGMRRAGAPALRTFQAEGVSCHNLPLGDGLDLCYGAVDESVVFALSRADLAKALRARRDQAERLTASDLWTKASRARESRAVFALLVDAAKLADNIRASLSQQDLESGGREAMAIMSAINWAAISAGVDGDNSTSKFTISVNWERLCEAISRVVEMQTRPPRYGPGSSGGGGRRGGRRGGRAA